MYSVRHAQEWFQKAIARSRETRNRNRRAQMDSSDSDCSVRARQPRHRDDPNNIRGKSKRVITALTTDSDTGPDSPRGTDRNNLHLRPVSPRVYNAPDLNEGIAPSFPSRLDWIRGQSRTASPRLMPARTPALEAPTLRGPRFRKRHSPPPSRSSL